MTVKYNDPVPYSASYITYNGVNKRVGNSGIVAERYKRAFRIMAMQQGDRQTLLQKLIADEGKRQWQEIHDEGIMQQRAEAANAVAMKKAAIFCAILAEC